MNEQDGIEFSGVNRSQKPGEQLRKIREEKRISLEEMAKQLRFTPQRLTQIEIDDYSSMGSGTFARGYLRSYARLLGMPESEVAAIVQLFDSQDLKTSIRSSAPKLLHEKIVHSNHKFLRGFGLLVILVAVILAGFWWHNNRNADKTADATAQDTTGVNPQDGNAQVTHPIPLQTTSTTSPDGNAAPTPAQAPPAQTAETAPPAADNPPATTKGKKATRARAAVSDDG